MIAPESATEKNLASVQQRPYLLFRDDPVQSPYFMSRISEVNSSTFRSKSLPIHVFQAEGVPWQTPDQLTVDVNVKTVCSFTEPPSPPYINPRSGYIPRVPEGTNHYVVPV